MNTVTIWACKLNGISPGGPPAISEKVHQAYSTFRQSVARRRQNAGSAPALQYTTRNHAFRVYRADAGVRPLGAGITALFGAGNDSRNSSRVDRHGRGRSGSSSLRL